MIFMASVISPVINTANPLSRNVKYTDRWMMGLSSITRIFPKLEVVVASLTTGKLSFQPAKSREFSGSKTFRETG